MCSENTLQTEALRGLEQILEPAQAAVLSCSALLRLRQFWARTEARHYLSGMSENQKK